MIGKNILHYRVIKKIGKGGMGVIYKAEDTRLHRIVALKVLSADLITEEKARARFIREARVASSINHPNICPVYEINEAEGSLFFVMQYIEGKTLKRLIRGRPLPIDEALECSLELTDALREAHDRNVIHRDIKSTNIMIDGHGHSRILDFGLAKLHFANEIIPSGALMADLTQAGIPFGTASYMSPEQVRGEPLDVRSDLFSLGVVIYEMVTGRLPFRGKGTADVMMAVSASEPVAINSDVPYSIRQIILRLLAKKKSDRYQSADELLSDLRSAIRNYYGDKGIVPAHRSSLLRATRMAHEAESAGFFVSILQSIKRMLKIGKSIAEESSGSDPFTAETTPSIVRNLKKKAIAILPFKNLSGDPATDFYGFSLADSVITELGQLSELAVRPSAYILQYQNIDIDPGEVGARLGVDAVLVGSYLKAGERFRVTTQFVDIKTGSILWSDKIDLDSRDLISIQDIITRQVVEKLRVRTTPAEQHWIDRLPTEDVEAYESYLRGRNLLYKFIIQSVDVADLDAATGSFKKAVDLDHKFALAHSGLGVCYLNCVLKGVGGLDFFSRAKQSFDRALELEPKLLEPRVRYVQIYMVEGKVDEAHHEIQKLLRLAPNDPSVHSTAANLYRLAGQYELALDEWERFTKVAPGDRVYASYNRARIYLYQYDFSKAEEEIRMGAATEPNHPLLRAFGAMIDFHRGNPASAARTLEDVLEKSPGLYPHRALLALCYHAIGERERALALLDERILGSARADQDMAYWIVSLYALDGNAILALEWLDRAISMGYENYPFIAIDANLNPIRNNPRFIELLDILKRRWIARSSRHNNEEDNFLD